MDSLERAIKDIEGKVLKLKSSLLVGSAGKGGKRKQMATATKEENTGIVFTTRRCKTEH